MATGFEITKWNPENIMTPATAVNVRAMDKAALLVERSVKLSFKKGTGLIYGKRRHQASVEGRPPAPDTGLLRSSIIHSIVTRRDTIDGLVGAINTVKYALHLEIGTKNMAARPYLRPAITRNRKKIEAIFKKANG